MSKARVQRESISHSSSIDRLLFSQCDKLMGCGCRRSNTLAIVSLGGTAVAMVQRLSKDVVEDGKCTEQSFA